MMSIFMEIAGWLQKIATFDDLWAYVGDLLSRIWHLLF